MQLDNILLHGRGQRPVVKICDFGYSKDEVAGSICKTACGTPEYMAPEVTLLPSSPSSPSLSPHPPHLLTLLLTHKSPRQTRLNRDSTFKQSQTCLEYIYITLCGLLNFGKLLEVMITVP